MAPAKPIKRPARFAEESEQSFASRRKRANYAEGVKRAVNLRISAALIDDAKAAGVNLSDVLQRALQERVQVERNITFARDNARALKAIDAFFEEHGALSDHLTADTD